MLRNELSSIGKVKKLEVLKLSTHTLPYAEILHQADRLKEIGLARDVPSGRHAQHEERLRVVRAYQLRPRPLGLSGASKDVFAV